ncbi:hypothetical protein M8J75_000085 [Diaphorina citri]|nr:hypothetical protein M8J75_000085 [Diaphorina citri]
MTTTQTGFTGFNTGGTTTTTAPTLNFGSGGGVASGFSFGGTSANLTNTTVSTSTGLSLGSLPSSTANQNTSFNFPTSTLTSQPQQTTFSAGSNATPATNTFMPSISAAATPTFNNKKTVTFGPSTAIPTSAQPTNVTTGLTSNVQGMTFSELEENLNKWQIMIEEHQRLFYNKVNALNSTDILLYENRVKLEKLNALTDAATAKQKALNEELNFIGQQQKDLDETVTSLEKQMEKIESDIPADTERTQT